MDIHPNGKLVITFHSRNGRKGYINIEHTEERLCAVLIAGDAYELDTLKMCMVYFFMRYKPLLRGMPVALQNASVFVAKTDALAMRLLVPALFQSLGRLPAVQCGEYLPASRNYK